MNNTILLAFRARDFILAKSNRLRLQVWHASILDQHIQYQCYGQQIPVCDHAYAENCSKRVFFVFGHRDVGSICGWRLSADDTFLRRQECQADIGPNIPMKLIENNGQRILAVFNCSFYFTRATPDVSSSVIRNIEKIAVSFSKSKTKPTKKNCFFVF